MKILVTGSCGLIGSEAVEFFGAQGHNIVGIDNNMRADFFGTQGNVMWRLEEIKEKVPAYKHYAVDIRNEYMVERIFHEESPIDVVIHCAAQPSHDKAREIPLVDHGVNATGTMNLLESTRFNSSHAIFIFMSTNKVYGDAPNDLRVYEYDTRYDYLHPFDQDGIDENCRVDRSTHSVFGANKLAADIMTQEYWHTYGLRTVVLRGGCLTGPGHSGVELHGFLSYLVKVACLDGHYKVYGYKGKQVRDNIHSRDVLNIIDAIIREPHPGEVYNIGGGRENSLSVIEAIAKIEYWSGKKIDWEYIPIHRVGDHICYITNMKKFKEHYPNWTITKSIDDIIRDMVRP